MWQPDFTRDILPVACHSHNDYWRQVPLYDALAAGCTGVEADVWLSNSTGTLDLLVGHNTKVLSADRSLTSLYVGPLVEILSQQQKSQNSQSPTNQIYGVYDTYPKTSLILLIDFKTDGNSTWRLVYDQLEELRKNDWLTYWNGLEIVSRPIVVVATGNAPFDRVLEANSTHRDIFFDAPLLDLGPQYNVSTSYYASAPIKEALGPVKRPSLKSKQIELLQEQISAAEERGLKSRYWDTPSWPVSWRNDVWTKLTDYGVGMLNVDELISASRWDWRWCVVGGITLCG